jgi:hypothetical protein
MQSGFIDFVVGKDRKRFSIHAALASSFPKEILQPPINSQVDEVVFGRCCEFVYSGNYTVPLPISNPSGSDSDQPSNRKAPPQRRWNPIYLTKNLFHPRKVPNASALIIERLDQEISYEESPLNTDPELVAAFALECYYDNKVKGGDALRLLADGFFHAGGESGVISAFKHRPRPAQCYNCQEMGHKAFQCKNT